MRTIVELPTGQIEALDALCQREGISRAEAVRRSVDHYLQHNRVADQGQAFGLWRARAVDSLAYEATLRREWDAPGTRAAKRR